MALRMGQGAENKSALLLGRRLGSLAPRALLSCRLGLPPGQSSWEQLGMELGLSPCPAPFGLSPPVRGPGLPPLTPQSDPFSSPGGGQDMSTGPLPREINTVSACEPGPGLTSESHPPPHFIPSLCRMRYIQIGASAKLQMPACFGPLACLQTATTVLC